jgi:hypothetical protein
VLTYRSNFESGNLGEVFFVVDTITQHVSKRSQGTFQAICGSLLLGFFKSRCFAFAVLDVAISDILTMVDQLHGPFEAPELTDTHTS